jgi:cytochrome oxidase Cu insertion factor (SCO1/SenC/PrrC family)
VTRHRLVFALAGLILLAASCDGRGSGAGMEDDVPPSEGDQAPAFSLPSVSGENVALSDFEGKKSVLLYFSMGPG